MQKIAQMTSAQLDGFSECTQPCDQHPDEGADHHPCARISSAPCSH